MAFNFGAPAPAAAGPAPAQASGFAFGGAPAAPTPAPPGGGLFGAPAPAAPAGGGLFGAPAPKPASGGGGLFGSTPAPAPAGGGLFGAPAAPAPAAGGLFGATPAPAPAAGGLFGSTAPAPAAGGLFGSTPAPASGGLFGSTPAPAPAAGGLFGAPVPATVQPMAQQQIMQQPFSGNTPYSQLPDNAKRAVDQIYQLMMQHRRTLASVKTMAPSLLVLENAAQGGGNGSVRGGGETPSPADAAAGSPRRTSQNNKANVDAANEPLPQQMVGLQTQIQTLLQSAETNLAEAQQLKSRAGEMAVQAKMHGAWPIENVAARRGVALSSIKGMLNDASANVQSTPGTLGGPVPAAGSSGTPASYINMSGMTNIDAIALQQIMDIRAKHVDRIESMPSPYFWEVLHNFEERVNMAQRDVEAVRARLAIAEEAERVRGAAGGMMMGGDMTSLMVYDGGNGPSAPLSKRLATLARSQYDRFVRISSEASRVHDGFDQMKLRYQRFYQNTKGGYYEDPFKKADTVAIGREREMQQRIIAEQLATASPPKATATAPGAPAPPGGLFGAPAPAPSGLFGASAPAPATGGLFGAPAPKPASGGLFGSTPAPVPAGGGLFGAAAPAPVGGGLFGAPAPAPAAGGLFGSTPAPAPATAGGSLFGSTPAPAPVFGAAPTTPASTLAPRKKSGGRSSGRRR